jgi:YegS/Rv2252/BmrU family lipid kinase
LLFQEIDIWQYLVSKPINMSLQNVLLIYNPVAGRYPSRMLTERAASIFKAYGWGVDIQTTQDGSHIPRLAEQAVIDNKDAVIIVGGDGSLNKSLPGLVGTDTALGVLPAGTANVWAQELHLPGLSWVRWKAIEESAHHLASGQIREMDVGLCNDKYFLLWAGIGLDAFIVHRIEPRKQWQKNFTIVHYAADVVWSASRWRGINLRLTLDEQIFEGTFMLAVISNIRLYAGGLATLSPQSQVDDGLMELWLFEGQNLEDILQQAWALWAGRHVDSDRVRCLPFREVKLESDDPIFVQMDGEPEVGGECVSIEVLPRKLKVLIPDQTPATLFKR